GSGPTLTLKAVCLCLLLAVGLTALPSAGVPEPGVPAAADPPAPAQIQPRLDRHGDPLPPGAVARLGTLRFRTAGEAVALAFAPDGQTIAVSSYAGVFLFDAASGKRTRRQPLPRSPAGPEDRLTFSPDSKRLAAQAR